MKKMDSNIRISEIIYHYLHGELPQDEEEMLRCWLEKEENRNFFMNLKNTNRIYEDLLDMQYMDTEVCLQQVEKSIIKKRRRTWRNRMIGSAATIVLVMGIFLLTFNRTEEKEPVVYTALSMPEMNGTILQTTTGHVLMLADTVKTLSAVAGNRNRVDVQQTSGQKEPLYNVLQTSKRGNIRVTLCDNTRVWLNAGSVLKYPNAFRGNKREVYLEGEAYFEVTKNADMPFVVTTGQGEIEVLGTEFNVRAPQSEYSVTTLVRGCVKVKGTHRDTVTIWPGQQVIIGRAGGMTVRSVDTRYYTAWRKNLFAFHEQTLYHIITSLAEWYDFEFSFESVELANLQYTTMLEKSGDVEDVLKILQQTGDFYFIKHYNGKIEIKSKI